MRFITESEYLKRFKCSDCVNSQVRFLESEFDSPEDATVICCECGDECLEVKKGC